MVEYRSIIKKIMISLNRKLLSGSCLSYKLLQSADNTTALGAYFVLFHLFKRHIPTVLLPVEACTGLLLDACDALLDLMSFGSILLASYNPKHHISTIREWDLSRRPVRPMVIQRRNFFIVDLNWWRL